MGAAPALTLASLRARGEGHRGSAMEATENIIRMLVGDAAGTENAPPVILESIVVPCRTNGGVRLRVGVT
nr:unnamed protein product [Digitaria exilis]